MDLAQAKTVDSRIMQQEYERWVKQAIWAEQGLLCAVSILALPQLWAL